MRNIKEMAGLKFGKLTVIDFAEIRTRGESRTTAFWNVECDCGTKLVVDGYMLRAGYTKNCGICDKNGSLYSEELTGKIFGRLTILERIPSEATNPIGLKRWKLSRWWKCKCQCGKELNIKSSEFFKDKPRVQCDNCPLNIKPKKPKGKVQKKYRKREQQVQKDGRL